MTRIVAGTAGGRRLAVPTGRETRPTSDRAREGLFDTLHTLLELAGSRVLDLYAGCGAVGLEALSRGARQALLVDSDARAAATARQNVAVLGFAGRAEVRRDRVERVLTAGPPDRQPYDLVFADPPYAVPDGVVQDMLGLLLGAGWLAGGAVVVLERPTRGSPLTWPDPIVAVKQRRYGEGTLWYGRRP